MSKPLDDQRYHLILDLGSKLLRVQCKWAARAGDVIAVRTRTCRRGRNGPTRNNQAAGIRWAKDYEFAARLTPPSGR